MKTKGLILCAVFAALTGICSIISIPLPFSPVPINLATLSVFLAGGLLGAKYGAISQIIYVLLGAVGVPVFHSLTSGLGILTGPTGGYIIGYILAAFIIGRIYSSTKHLLLALLAGIVACYALGTLWFIYLTGVNLWSALLMCVIPFIPGDIIKILAALLLIKKLKRFLDMY
jgi:biotin transport system substrate-specific component